MMGRMPDRDWQAVLVRHGETEWSRDGRHTGRTDVPLTDNGREDARCIGDALRGCSFVRVLSSPLQRALETCRLAGLGDRVEIHPSLLEWDYGDYEGLTTAQIRELRPDWWLWRDGCPGGEKPQDVARRVDPVVAELLVARGDVALFAHGHVLRVLGARWIEQGPLHGSRLALSTASISAGGFEHDLPVLHSWNDVSHLPPERRPR
jgi:broad specificity phosphatase PhoE